MISGHTAYNQLLQTRPELVEELYGHQQRKALDALDRALNDPANYTEFTLQPGDVLFADNYATLHHRRAFVDAPEVDARRCLVRLWPAGAPRN